jgi:hypothetical protein
MAPSFKRIAKISDLKPMERICVKDKTAVLFKVVEGEMRNVGLNGKILN